MRPFGDSDSRGLGCPHGSVAHTGVHRGPQRALQGRVGGQAFCLQQVHPRVASACSLLSLLGPDWRAKAPGRHLPGGAAASLCLFRTDSRYHREWRMQGAQAPGGERGAGIAAWCSVSVRGPERGARKQRVVEAKEPRQTDGGTQGGMEDPRERREMFQRGDIIAPEEVAVTFC